MVTNLTEIEKFQFALKKLEAAKTREEFLLARDDDSNGINDYPCYYEWCKYSISNELWIGGIGYSIHLHPGEVDMYIKDHYPDAHDAREKAAEDYLFTHSRDIIEEVKATIKELEEE